MPEIVFTPDALIAELQTARRLGIQTIDVQARLAGYRRAIDQCAKFLQILEITLAPRHVLAPEPKIAADGEVALSWNFTDCRIEVGFVGDDFYSCFVFYPDGTCFGSKAQLLDPLPKDLVIALKQSAL